MLEMFENVFDRFICSLTVLSHPTVGSKTCHRVEVILEECNTNGLPFMTHRASGPPLSTLVGLCRIFGEALCFWLSQKKPYQNTSVVFF